MSILLESLNIPDGWSRAYISQLASYVRNRDIDGYYYGNKEQFEKRHKSIMAWIENLEEKVYADGTYVFKKANK